jgi:subtilisin family serine protease
MNKLDASIVANKTSYDLLVTFDDTESVAMFVSEIEYAVEPITIIKQYATMPLARVNTTMDGALFLSSIDAVVWIKENSKVSAGGLINYSAGVSGVPAGGIGEDYLWDLGYNGSGMVIAVVDTGINNTHPDLDDIDDDPATTDPKVIDRVNKISFPYPGYNSGVYDDNGHGTHCAGIASGTGNASSGMYMGVAPASKLVGVKVLGAYGDGVESSVIDGIEYAVDRGDVDIISLSLGGYSSNPNDAMSQAVSYAWDNGIIVVCAAGNRGNSGYGTIDSPGHAVKVITVGATDGDMVTSWSSKGFTVDSRMKPSVVAPGESIISTLDGMSTIRNQYASQIIEGVGGDYVPLSGTSMATPHIAGLSACLLQAFPSSSNDVIKSAIMESADDLGNSEYVEGFGRANGTEAYDFLLNNISNHNLTITPSIFPQDPYQSTIDSLPYFYTYKLTAIPTKDLSDVDIVTSGELAKYVSFSATHFDDLNEQNTMIAYINIPEIFPHGKMNCSVDFFDSSGRLGGTMIEIDVSRNIDLGEPLISDITRIPTDVYYDDFANITASVTDEGSGIDSVIVYYSDDYGEWTPILASICPTNTYYSGISGDPTYVLGASIEAHIPALAYGRYVRYKVWANDTYGNIAESSIYSYTVSDATIPNIVNVVQNPEDPDIDESVNVRCEVIDDVDASEIDTVLLLYSDDMYEWDEIIMTEYESSKYEGDIAGRDEGIIWYKIWANDSAGNTNETKQYNYTLPLIAHSCIVVPERQVKTRDVVFQVQENDVAYSVKAEVDGTNHTLTETSNGLWSYTFDDTSDLVGEYNVTFYILAVDDSIAVNKTIWIDELEISDVQFESVIEAEKQTVTFESNYSAKPIVYWRKVGESEWSSVEGYYDTSHSVDTPILFGAGDYELQVEARLETGYNVTLPTYSFEVQEASFDIVWKIADNVHGIYSDRGITLDGWFNSYHYDFTTNGSGYIDTDIVGDLYNIMLEDGVNEVTIQREVIGDENTEIFVYFANSPPQVSDVNIDGYIQSQSSITISFVVTDLNSLNDVAGITLILYSDSVNLNSPDSSRTHYTFIWSYAEGWVCLLSDTNAPTITDLKENYTLNETSDTFQVLISLKNCDDLSDWNTHIDITDGESGTQAEQSVSSWINGNAVIEIFSAIVNTLVVMLRNFLGILLAGVGAVVGVSKYNKVGSFVSGAVIVVGFLTTLFINPIATIAISIGSAIFSYGGIATGVLLRRTTSKHQKNYCKTRKNSSLCNFLLPKESKQKIKLAKRKQHTRNKVSKRLVISRETINKIRKSIKEKRYR